MGSYTMQVGTHPIIRRIILEQFLKVRQSTKETVTEENNRDAHVKIVTHSQYSAEGALLCEDIFVEART